MKKLIVLTVLLVLLLTINVSANDKFYWDELVASPEIQYTPMEGKVGYNVVPLEFWGKERLTDGLEHELNLQLGIMKNTQFNGSLSLYNTGLLAQGTVQSHFYNTDHMDAAVQIGYYHLDEDTQWINTHVKAGSLALLTSADLGNDITWHNNFLFNKTIYPGPWNGTIESGMTLFIRPNLAAKVKGDLNFKKNSTSVGLTTACKWSIRDNLDYIVYLNKDFSQLNYQFEHVLEARPAKGREVVLQITHNTTDDLGAHNAAKLGIEQQILENVTLASSVEVHLKYKIHTYLNLGVSVDL